MDANKKSKPKRPKEFPLRYSWTLLLPLLSVHLAEPLFGISIRESFKENILGATCGSVLFIVSQKVWYLIEKRRASIDD